jgi:predicted nucleic acid-binding protein
MVKIIFNSSPLIFLARLDYLETFVDSVDDFYLPEFVSAEIKAKQDNEREYIQRLINDNQIEVRTVNLISLANSLNARLGKGESEAIALATELQADYVILDDFAARKEAMRLGLNVRGTLAIIRKLNKDGKIVIENLDELYQRLMEINFRIKRAVFDSIFAD